MWSNGSGFYIYCLKVTFIKEVSIQFHINNKIYIIINIKKFLKYLKQFLVFTEITKKIFIWKKTIKLLMQQWKLYKTILSENYIIKWVVA